MNNSKKPSLLVLVLSAFLVFSFVATAPVMADAKTQSESVKKKKKSKNFKAKFGKKKAVKKTKKKSATKTTKKLPAVSPVDESVSEPSEMILAIKNRAERAFWNGKRPLKDQALNNSAAPAMERSDTLSRASFSEVSGVTFDDQPLRMPESDAFRKSLDAVSFELGKTCTSREYLGWPLQQTEQKRVDRIFTETNEKLKLRGFSITPRTPRSVGSDVSVFTAQRLNKNVLGLWSAGDAGLLLIACETKGAPDVANAAPEKAAQKKSKKKKLKKISKPANDATLPAVAPKDGEKRPEVIPGGTKEDKAPEAPAAETKPAETAPAAAAPTPAPAFVPVIDSAKPAAPAVQETAPPVKVDGPTAPAAPIEQPAAPAAPTPPQPTTPTVIAPPTAPVGTPPAPAAIVAPPKAADVVAPAIDKAVDTAKDAATDAVKKELPTLPAVPAAPVTP